MTTKVSLKLKDEQYMYTTERTCINEVQTAESQYLKLGYVKFCPIRSVYLNQKYIFIVFFQL